MKLSALSRHGPVTWERGAVPAARTGRWRLESEEGHAHGAHRSRAPSKCQLLGFNCRPVSAEEGESCGYAPWSYHILGLPTACYELLGYGVCLLPLPTVTEHPTFPTRAKHTETTGLSTWGVTLHQKAVNSSARAPVAHNWPVWTWLACTEFRHGR